MERVTTDLVTVAQPGLVQEVLLIGTSRISINLEGTVRIEGQKEEEEIEMEIGIVEGEGIEEIEMEDIEDAETEEIEMDREDHLAAVRTEFL